MVYELYYNRQIQELQEMNRYMELEKRIAKIEGAIGNWKESSEFASIASTIEFLNQMVHGLSPVLIEERTRTMEKCVAELKQCLGQKGEEKVEFDKGEIDQLFELSQSALEYYKAIPKVVERLSALKYLHEQSAGLMNRIVAIEQMQTTIQGSLKETDELLGGVKSGMEKNMKTVESNLKSLDERLAKLTTK